MSDEQDYHCYFDEQGCVVCPERPERAPVAAYIQRQPVLGWNSGANSIATRDGDFRVKFDMPLFSVGVMLGLKTSRQKQTLPTLIEHGWYFQSVASTSVAQVIENGQMKTAVQTHTDGDQYEIRRVNGRVYYAKNDTIVYTSAAPSFGPKIVNCCLYASNDAAPSGESDGPTPPDPSDHVLENGVTVAAECVDCYDSLPSCIYYSFELEAGVSQLDVVLGGDTATAQSVSLYMVLKRGSQPTDETPDNNDAVATDLPGTENDKNTISLYHMQIMDPEAGLYYLMADSAVAGLTFTATWS